MHNRHTNGMSKTDDKAKDRSEGAMAKPIADLKVSAVICTYNRYDMLVQAIESVRAQTHANIEIIVVNDGSTDPRYNARHFDEVVWIDQKPNSRVRCGFPSPGYCRNTGLQYATGEYIAFLDDDDIWLPNKTKAQLEAIATHGVLMSCTEGYKGKGMYDPTRSYPHFHDYWAESADLPDFIDLEMVRRSNPLIQSSTMVQRALLDQVGPLKETPYGGTRVNGKVEIEDWDLWQRCLVHTDCVFLKTPLVYYDEQKSPRETIRYKLKLSWNRVLRRMRIKNV